MLLDESMMRLYKLVERKMLETHDRKLKMLLNTSYVHFFTEDEFKLSQKELDQILLEARIEG